jgi:methyl-accepting chemotaxis protein
MNLQKKAMYIIAGILFLVIGINSMVLTFLASNKYRKVILAKTTSIGEGLQQKLNEISSAGIPVSGIVGVGKELHQLVQNDETIGFALVADTSGWIIFHNDDAKKGRRLSEPELISHLSSQQKITKETGSYYNIFFPLFDVNKQVTAMLIIGVKTQLVGELIYWIVMISTICLLFAIGLVYFSISKHITEPILRVEKVAEKIASGNLTEELVIRGEDEIAMLGKAVNKISNNLRQMLLKIAETSKGVFSITVDVNSTADESLRLAHNQRSSIEEAMETVNNIKGAVSDVSRSAEVLMASAEHVSAATTAMTASVETLAARATAADVSAAETASSVEEMSANIKGISETVEQLVASYDSIYSSVTRVTASVRKVEINATESARLVETVRREASESGLTAAHASLEGMENIKVTVGSLTETINMLGNRSEDIGRIIEVIDEIADRTNLLALNSAILAAQAGQYGKPFEVVSKEMKDLADKTSEATMEIGKVISSVQDKIGESVNIAVKGMETIAKGFKLVSDTNKVLHAIKESSEKSTEMSREIQMATAEQSEAISQVTNAMGNMTEMFQYINKAIYEQSKANRHIVASMEETKKMSHAAMDASEEQKIGNREVSLAMQTVVARTQQILRAAKDQHQMSAAIEHSMDKVRDSALKVEKAAGDLEGIVFLLKNESGSLLTEVQQITLEGNPLPTVQDHEILAI